MPNFVKIGRSVVEMKNFQIFKMVAAILDLGQLFFFNFIFLTRDAMLAVYVLCLSICLNQGAKWV